MEVLLVRRVILPWPERIVMVLRGRIVAETSGSCLKWRLPGSQRGAERRK
jgi:hypothetical protein